jgi:surface antigen
MMRTFFKFRNGFNFLVIIVIFELSLLCFSANQAKAVDEFGNINPSIRDSGDSRTEDSGRIGNFQSSQDDSFGDDGDSVNEGVVSGVSPKKSSSKGSVGVKSGVFSNIKIEVKNGYYYLVGPDGKLRKITEVGLGKLLGLSSMNIPAKFWRALGIDPLSAGAKATTSLSALALAIGLLVNGGKVVSNGIRYGSQNFSFSNSQLTNGTLTSLSKLISEGLSSSYANLVKIFGADFFGKLSSKANFVTDKAASILNGSKNAVGVFGKDAASGLKSSKQFVNTIPKTVNGTALNEVISGNEDSSNGLMKAGLQMNEAARQSDGKFKLGEVMGWFYGVEVYSNGVGLGVKKVNGADYMDGQCVAFVKRFYEVTGGVNWGPIGNADVYTSSEQMSKIGFQVFEDSKTTEIPKCGDLFATTAGNPGHVGIVNKVNVDADGHGSYTVVSQNVGDGKTAETTYKFTVSKQTGVVNLHNQGGVKVTFARPVDSDKQLNLPSPESTNEFNLGKDTTKNTKVSVGVSKTFSINTNLSSSSPINTSVFSGTANSTSSSLLQVDARYPQKLGTDLPSSVLVSPEEHFRNKPAAGSGLLVLGFYLYVEQVMTVAVWAAEKAVW